MGNQKPTKDFDDVSDIPPAMYNPDLIVPVELQREPVNYNDPNLKLVTLPEPAPAPAAK